MKLTILGSGTVVPDGSRNSAGYFLELPSARVMLDCGAGAVHALARYGLPWERMTHLFISHFHVDHVGELASLFAAFKHGMRSRRTEPLTVVGPRGLDRVIDGLKQALSLSLFEPGFPVSVVMIDPGGDLHLSADCVLTVAKTLHNEESLAVRIECDGRALCYTGDTEYANELASFFKGADLLISECSLREHREGMRHVTVGEVAKLAAAAAVSRLVVTHFYFAVDESQLRAELESGYSGRVIVGSDGMSIEIP